MNHQGSAVASWCAPVPPPALSLSLSLSRSHSLPLSRRLPLSATPRLSPPGPRLAGFGIDGQRVTLQKPSPAIHGVVGERVTLRKPSPAIH